jgi:phosphoribosyl 1,2-cyclic phosphodiesterase
MEQLELFQPAEFIEKPVGARFAVIHRNMRIRFWGVRGSIATASPETTRVGGNTSCVEVLHGETRLILDAGTGLRALGAELEGTIEAHILLSHFHWDHLQGFPFFAPAYRPGNRIEVYGPSFSALDTEAALRVQMQSPHFPVGLEAMRAALRFHSVTPGGSFRAGELEVRTLSVNHPNGCLAYRISSDAHSIVFATDLEHQGDATLLERFCAGADVLIYDAQYTDEEYPRFRGWGHSTASEGVRIARAAGVGQLVLFHHDPSHDDWQVARIEAEARQQFAATVAAREGLTLDLGATQRLSA